MKRSRTCSGVATAFFYEPLGHGPLQASYLQGKDLSVPAGAFGRSLSNPALTGDPDHYLLGGDTTGTTRIIFNGVDAAGRPIVVSTPRTTLLTKWTP